MPDRSPLLDDPTFQVFLQSPTEITALLDSDGELLYVSPSVEDVLGRRPEDQVGIFGLDNVHPEDRERVREELAELVAAPGASVQTEYRVRHEDGSWRVLNTHAWNLLEDERVGAVLLRSRDVTENRALRARVGRTERYLEQLVNHVPVVFYLLDADGTVLLSEGRGLEDMGLRPGEVVGRSAFDLYPEHHTLTTAMKKALDGEEVRAELNVEGRVYETLLTPRTDEEGRVLGVSGVSLDRTEEVRAREADAFKARLLDFIGHDFNNMITAIRGYARLLLEEVGPDEERLRPDLEEIDRVAERAGEITAQLLAYGRRQVSQPRRLDLVETVGSMTGVLSRLVGEDVGLTFAADEGPCPVEIDPSQVERMVLNLAVNARDAMSRGGELEIRVRPADPEAVSAAEPGCEEEEGPWVELSVRDTGRGIAEAHLPHVFEPFYTTKARGGGTGLGLATVQGVAMQNGGCVAVESEPGEGATFRVYLPRVGTPDVRPQGEQL